MLICKQIDLFDKNQISMNLKLLLYYFLFLIFAVKTNNNLQKNNPNQSRNLSLSQQFFSDKSDDKTNRTTVKTQNLQIYGFLDNFSTRSDFCFYRCQTVYNLICFFKQGCGIQIRNIILVGIIPLVWIIMGGLLCSLNIWNVGCWKKYLKLFLCIYLLDWILKKIRSAYQKNKQINLQTQLQKKKQLKIEAKKNFQKHTINKTSEKKRNNNQIIKQVSNTIIM